MQIFEKEKSSFAEQRNMCKTPFQPKKKLWTGHFSSKWGFLKSVVSQLTIDRQFLKSPIAKRVGMSDHIVAVRDINPHCHRRREMPNFPPIFCVFGVRGFLLSLLHMMFI